MTAARTGPPVDDRPVSDGYAAWLAYRFSDRYAADQAARLRAFLGLDDDPFRVLDRVTLDDR